MKTAILALAACFITIVSLADSKDISVPAPVQKAFTDQYKGVTVKEWGHEGDTLIAQFKVDHQTHFAYYKPDGTWLMTEDQLHHISQLPKPVAHSFNRSHYAAWNIDDILAVEVPGKQYYTVAVFRANGPSGAIANDVTDRYKIYFNPDGAIYKTDTIMQPQQSLKPVISKLLK